MPGQKQPLNIVNNHHFTFKGIKCFSTLRLYWKKGFNEITESGDVYHRDLPQLRSDIYSQYQQKSTK